MSSISLMDQMGRSQCKAFLHGCTCMWCIHKGVAKDLSAPAIWQRSGGIAVSAAILEQSRG